MENPNEMPPLVDEWNNDEELAKKYREAGFIVESTEENDIEGRTESLGAAPNVNFWTHYKAYGHGRPLRSQVTKNCFVASAIYGDENAPEVKTLREYRDDVLMQSTLGRKIIGFYYSGFGEGLAKLVKNHAPSAIPVIKKGLDYIVEKYRDKE